MSFPNLLISSLKVIRPKEYGLIALTLMGIALASSSKASVVAPSSLNEDIFHDASKSKRFSLLTSVSSSLADLSQDSTTRFDVEMRRQKTRGLFSSCLIARVEPPCKVTTVFSSSLENAVDFTGKSILRGETHESAA